MSTGLVSRVHVARRFQRSVRIDTDLSDPKALEGFILPHSSAVAIETMVRQIADTGHGAYTWTGPYGSGKSSLVVAFGALVNGNPELRSQAAKIFGKPLVNLVTKQLPPGPKGWKVIPVVGRRDDPVRSIGESIARATSTATPPGGWTEPKLLEAIEALPKRLAKAHGGVFLFIDEMGKFLEHVALSGSDLYFFQQLAEVASRSGGKLLVVGVLHQAFEEYATRLSHQARDEWSKIQGRFVDLPISVGPEEQLDLLSRAIESDHDLKRPSQLAQRVAKLARAGRPNVGPLAELLEGCWPLHAVTACLLGPLSRRRFGQNQRSLFGFLNSAEPSGFNDFLRNAATTDLFLPERLWDYLRANLEPSILASPDGHRWALAVDALERCDAIGGSALHLGLLKTIAIVDLLKDRTGLVAGTELLRTCFPGESDAALKKALAQLSNWSFILFRKFSDAYSIFAGSDFDIDEALRSAIEQVEDVDLNVLRQLADLQPVLAKRHYHETGALRWFDVGLASLADVAETAAAYEARNGSIGQFLLTIPMSGERGDVAAERCREAARNSDAWDVVVGASPLAWNVVEVARELIALENVRQDRPELSGDAVARREIEARVADLQSQVETSLRKAFDGATWYRKHHQPKTLRQAEISSLASDLADKRYEQSPRLHNELLNRQKPSGSAIAAQNILLRKMVMAEGQQRLGIEGYPAEGGLFVSILEATGLYREKDGKWSFACPEPSGDPSALAPAWAAGATLLRETAERAVAVEELYQLWSMPPFGIKDGLMPILAVAFILSNRNHVAIYRDGVFRARFDDVDVDYLAKDPAMIQLRWMDMSHASRSLLSGFADAVRTINPAQALVHLEPIDVARALMSIFDQLSPWTKRTARLSSNAVRIRNLFKHARDPNKLLFDDLPTAHAKPVDLDAPADVAELADTVRAGLQELSSAHGSMLHRLRDLMLSELQVPNLSPQSLQELRERAANIHDLAGDFRLDAFVARLAKFDDMDATFEGIGSLAADKPPREWTDADVDRAAIEIADLSQRFLRAETFARVKGRPQTRQALAVVVGLENRPAPLLAEFEIGEADRAAVKGVVKRIEEALDLGDRRDVILAALAELSARFMAADETKPTRKRAGGR